VAKVANENETALWLYRRLLGTHGVHVDRIRDEAKRAGFSRADLAAARKKLRVSTYHRFDRGYPTKDHYWHLPTENPDMRG
jgi:hypothetical protein